MIDGATYYRFNVSRTRETVLRVETPLARDPKFETAQRNRCGACEGNTYTSRAAVVAHISMNYRLVSLLWGFEAVSAWYTQPNYVEGLPCVTSNGLPGNCVSMDSNGHNDACHHYDGFLVGDVCSNQVPFVQVDDE
jgi:hypothetical protein